MSSDTPHPTHDIDETGGDPACWAHLFESDWAADGDLTTATDVHDLVVDFYRELVFDDLLGPYFEGAAEVDWAAHIPKLVAYWCWTLLGTPGFAGEVTRAHRDLQRIEPITPDLCDRWYALWVTTIDRRWHGPQADRAADHAATLMSAMAKRLFGFSWSPRPRAATT